MMRHLLFYTVFIGFLGGSVLLATPPNIVGGTTTRSLREAEWTPITVRAVDPDGGTLNYVWTIESDPTGAAFILENLNTNTIRVGLPKGPNHPQPTYVGQHIRVRCDVSNATETASHFVDIEVTGVNHEPVILTTTSLGTSLNPVLPGGGVGIDAGQSYDPDGGEVKFFWSITTSGVVTCGTQLVLFNNYAPNPSLLVPELRTGGTITFNMVVEDTLLIVQKSFTAYVAPDSTPCSTETTPPTGGPPIVSLSANPASARPGNQVNLTATVTNLDPLETYTYSWRQLSGTTQNSVGLVSINSPNVSFQAPNITAVVGFEVTVQNSHGQGVGQVNVSISPGGTGPGANPGNTPQETSNSPSVPTRACASGTPPTANIPSQVKQTAGGSIAITATNISPAMIEYPTGPGPTPVVWNVVDGKGKMTNSSFGTTRNTYTVRFTAPTVAVETTFAIEAVVSGAGVGLQSCANHYPVNVVVTPYVGSTNKPPQASVRYRKNNQSEQNLPGNGAIQLSVPASGGNTSLTLDATGSIDEDGDPISFSWTVNATGLSAGGLVNSGPSSASVRVLEFLPGSMGTVSATLTVRDSKNAETVLTVTINLTVPASPPRAMAALRKPDGSPVSGPLANGAKFELDPTGTRLEDGSSANLTYHWEQIGGSAKAQVDLGILPVIETSSPGQAKLELTVAGVTEPTNLSFRLTVSNGDLEDSETVSLQVIPGSSGSDDEGSTDLYFPQVGFGPVQQMEFVTLLILDNTGSEPADDVKIAFLNDDGIPFTVKLGDETWDSETPFTLPAHASRVLEFRSADGGVVEQGWAKVTSSFPLRGSCRFQLLDPESNSFVLDVGIASSRQGKTFQTAFRKRDRLGFALANSGDQDLMARIELNLQDGTSIGLPLEPIPPGGHAAAFLKQIFGPIYDVLESDGTMTVRIEQGTGIATVLITDQAGLPASAQSFSRAQ